MSLHRFVVRCRDLSAIHDYHRLAARKTAQTFLNHNPELVAGFQGIEAVIAQYASGLGAGVYSFVSALLPHIAAVPAATVATAAPSAT